jgi:glycosyltransferase involved in cell wall biosynthesis
VTRFSVIIATYNRAGALAETLASLARVNTPEPWELIVVDNNSTDDTRQVVERAAAAFPARLRYTTEREQGRSAALNRGLIEAAGSIVVTTDDDVRVEPDWLTRIDRALSALDCEYIGGRVLPIWGGARPQWLPDRGGHMWAVIALLDFGPDPVPLGRRVPLGVNMAFRREALDRVGGFNTRMGRKAGTLLGQEVRDWCLRAREAGLRGCYAPDVVVHHVIPVERLRKSYFRRWFYWRGVSRAMLYAERGVDMDAPEQSTLDYSRVPHLAGVPRYMFRNALAELRRMVAATLLRRPAAAFERETQVWFFAGILAQRWKDRRRGPAGTSRAVTQAVSKRASR